MGNEMGNNNTSGFREEDNTVEDKSLQEFGHADSLKGQNHVVPETLDEDSQGKEDPNGHDQKTENKEEDDMKTEGKKSLEDAARTDNDNKEQYHEVPASEDVDVKEKETGLASINPEGVAEPHDDNQKLDEKVIMVGVEEDDSMIPVDKERYLQEPGYAEEAKGQDHLVPATEDKNTHGNESELASHEHDGLASPHIEDRNQDEKERDTSTIPEVEEIALQEATGTDETNAEARRVPAGGDEDRRGTETRLVRLVLSDGDGMAYPCIDKQKNDEKEEDGNINDEAGEQSSQEAASTDIIDRQGDQLAVVEDKTIHGNETGLVSIDPQGTADPHSDTPKDHDETGLISIDPVGTADPHSHNPKDHEREENNRNAERQEKPPTEDDDHEVDIEEKDLTIPAAEGEDYNNTEAEPASGDPVILVDALDDQTLEGQEQGKTELQPPAESTEVDAKPSEVVGEGSETQTVSSSKNLEDHEMHEELNFEENLSLITHHFENQNSMTEDDEGTSNSIPGAASSTAHDSLPQEPAVQEPEEHEVAKIDSEQLVPECSEPLQSEDMTIPSLPCQDQENGFILDPSISNDLVESVFPDQSPQVGMEDHEMQKESNFEEHLYGRTHHFENRNSMIEAEDEGTSNSISGTASSTSHDFVPQEPAFLEPEDHELAKIDTEQLELECIGPLQENGFILDSSVSTDPVQSVLPDQSLEVRMESDESSVKEMAIKEVSSEEKFELEDEGEAGNNLGALTTIMTDLPMGSEAKCNGELPSEMNSTKKDSPESQVEAILSDETVQNILVEVSESEDNGIVRKATSVKEESQNGNSKHSHCQIQSGENSIKKSNGPGSQQGSRADEPNAFQPQFMMNGHQNEKQICLLDTSCDSKYRDKDCQFLQAKIIDNGHLVDASINYQNEAPEEQKKDSRKEVLLITDTIVVSADTFVMDQIYKEEESEEKKTVEEMVKKKKDSNPIENDDSPRRENGQQCTSRSYPIEQAEAFVSLSPFLHEKQQQDTDLECKKDQNSNESMAEVKQESSECPKSTDPVTLAETKPSVKQSSEQCAIGERQTPEVIANGDYYQRETVGRHSIESNPDNSTIHAQMRKSPSFDLDLRIDVRAEETDQTPLLYQDKTTIESFSSQADATDPGKPAANSEYGENPSQCESMAAQEKVFTPERSDSEKSKTPFLGFLKENEEADQMLINPKQKDNQSATKKKTKVSAKDVTTPATKGKEKRKPRGSLFATCMCCATATN